MDELAYVKRLRDKLDGLKNQHAQLVANMNAVSGAMQFIEEELADQQKESQHADGEQTVSQ